MVIDPLLNKFVWDWTQVSGGAAAGFRILFGFAPGDRSNAYNIPDPAARSVLISDVITGAPGLTVFAVVVAFNSAGVSAESNEVSFSFAAAPTVPDAPTNFRIEPV